MATSQPSQPTQNATQQATQPYADPRRQVRTLSQMSENDTADIICVLHANSPMAINAIRATMLTAPEHILQNEDLDGVTEEDLAVYPELEKRTREIALRMSSTVKLPREGFRFGRNPQSCDVLLTDNSRDKLVSNVHFRIFINEQGSLMVQDCSTNGTWLDDEYLRSKDKAGRPYAKPAKRALKHGSIITVVVGPDREQIKLMVRVPSRTEQENVYEERLREYLRLRGVVPKFSSIRESSFGNHWTGGSVYNFTGLLGKGAFALVYRVQTKNEGTVYAAKEIDKRRFIKNGVLDVKFDNELLIMRKLKHPNIVDYVDCQIYENWIYIIMEYIPYGELSKELATRGKLPENEVQQITKQTLRALDYLHRQGVTHRDIKPDNILISSRNPLIVKLSDFGLSKSVVDQETFLKTFCGTLLYCAPEVYPDYNSYAQAASKRRRTGEPPSRTSPYNSSADMWSFGAVIFHLLAGKAPIMGRGENHGAQMLNNIMTKPVDFEPLREVGASAAAVDFINALLNKTPALRPQERDCFDHLWLRNVPDILDYSTVEDIGFQPRATRLEDLEEADEDEAEQELINDVRRLTQDPRQVPAHEDPPSTPSSPDRPIKKPKMARDESKIPAEILYPHLPTTPQTFSGKAESSKAAKLFGEITPSLLKSSGLFGGITSAGASPVIQQGEMPQISTRLRQVSMNDFASSPTEAVGPVETHPLKSDKPFQVLDVSLLQRPLPGPAASLLGAEEQMGQMNMGSPDGRFTEAPTLDTNDAVTPARSTSAGDHTSSQRSQQPAIGDQLRQIDVNLLTDEVAFAAEQQVREAAREENARLKAQTFHTPAVIDFGATTMASGLAQTFNGYAQKTMPASEGEDPQSDSSGRTEIWRQMTTNTFVTPVHDFGQLVPVEGSFSQDAITLTRRSTVWGRAPQCNCRYGDLQDVRVPKFGMKIVFYAPGIEEVERQSEDWTQVSKIRTVIATSATRGIKINGELLMQESDDGRAALFGKIYSGDVITIVDSSEPDKFLKYRVEIVFGDSARQRPETEQPFVIQREYNHHAKMKEQSMRAKSHQADKKCAISLPANEVTVA